MKQIAHRSYLLGQALAGVADGVLRREFDLGFSEFLLMRGVAVGHLTSQGDLAAIVGIGVTGISRIVTRLSARDLLRLEADPRNRRRNRIALTDKGAALLVAADNRLDSEFDAVAGDTASAADLAVFERVLDSLLASLPAFPDLPPAGG